VDDVSLDIARLQPARQPEAIPKRFFALLTERPIRRGIHSIVAALNATITAFIDQHNADPKPFRWTKSADDILASSSGLRVQRSSSSLISMLRTSGWDTRPC